MDDASGRCEHPAPQCCVSARLWRMDPLAAQKGSASPNARRHGAVEWAELAKVAAASGHICGRALCVCQRDCATCACGRGQPQSALGSGAHGQKAQSASIVAQQPPSTAWAVRRGCWATCQTRHGGLSLRPTCFAGPFSSCTCVLKPCAHARSAF